MHLNFQMGLIMFPLKCANNVILPGPSSSDDRDQEEEGRLIGVILFLHDIWTICCAMKLLDERGRTRPWGINHPEPSKYKLQYQYSKYFNIIYWALF